MSLSDTTLGALVESRRSDIYALVRRHRGRAISVFGSVARGDADEASDIDFLVEFDEGTSLFDLMHLEDELCELLGRPVDVVSVGALLDRDNRIRADAVPL